MNKETLNKLKELCERGGKATNVDIVDLRELIALAERTTSPVSQMTDEQRSVLMSHAVLFEYSGFIDQARHLRDIVAAAAPAAPGPDPAPIYKHRDDGTVTLTNADKMPSYADIDKVAWKIHEAHAAQPQPVAEQGDIIDIAKRAGLWEQRSGVWMAVGGEAELKKFAELIAASQQAAEHCNHRIVDARNPIITSGYMCIDCGGLFAAADHNGGKQAAVPVATTANPMCEFKTADIMKREGYKKTGYVLMSDDPKARICVSDKGAVSWFTPEQWWWLMHNRDHVEFEWPKPIGAAPAIQQPQDEREIPEGETGWRPACCDRAKGEDCCNIGYCIADKERAELASIAKKGGAANCQDNEGYGCACDPMNKAASANTASPRDNDGEKA